MKRILSLVLCLALLFLCGCTGSEKPYVPTGDALMDADDEGPAPTAPQKNTVDSLVLAYYPEQSLNPYQCTDFTNRVLFSLVYQGLFSTDRDYQVQPVLCKQYSVTADLRTYTFRLENATFSDGSALTAQDVVTSLLTAKESTMYKGRFLHIQEVSISGGDVVITLDTPMENLPLLLDIPIVKASQVAENAPMGTGPYVLTASVASANLHRRSNWWSDTTLQITAPTIALVPAASPTQIRDEFEFSDLSLVCADPCSDRYVDYRCDYELWDCESGMFMYISFCKDKEDRIFSDPKLRAALTYAIDRETIVNEFYRGFARSTTLPTSPLFPNYSPTLAGRYAYDPMKFSKAINDAGLTGTTITMLVNKEDSMRLRVAKVIAESIETCGLKVELSQLSGREYTDALLYREFDLHLSQTRLSPNMDLSAFFHTNGALSHGGVNDTAAYSLSLQALENHGNYYTLYQTVMDEGLLCPILTGSYAVYATRGLLTGLTPARDNIFYHDSGKTMEQALFEQQPATEPAQAS